jgi:hypothetical protein
MTLPPGPTGVKRALALRATLALAQDGATKEEAQTEPPRHSGLESARGQTGADSATAQPLSPSTVRRPIPWTRTNASRFSNPSLHRSRTIAPARAGPMLGRLSSAIESARFRSRGKPKSNRAAPSSAGA